jgi:uracil DNA glycosylase
MGACRVDQGLSSSHAARGWSQFRVVVSDVMNNREPIRLAINGGKRVHKADELISAIVAKRLVEHLER